jgi:hypothetical protein
LAGQPSLASFGWQANQKRKRKTTELEKSTPLGSGVDHSISEP